MPDQTVFIHRKFALGGAFRTYSVHVVIPNPDYQEGMDDEEDRFTTADEFSIRNGETISFSIRSDDVQSLCVSGQFLGKMIVGPAFPFHAGRSDVHLELRTRVDFFSGVDGLVLSEAPHGKAFKDLPERSVK